MLPGRAAQSCKGARYLFETGIHATDTRPADSLGALLTRLSATDRLRLLASDAELRQVPRPFLRGAACELVLRARRPPTLGLPLAAALALTLVLALTLTLVFRLALIVVSVILAVPIIPAIGRTAVARRWRWWRRC